MQRLHNYIKDLLPEGICIAFSGGVDSSLLLKVASIEAEQSGGRVYALTFESPLHAKIEKVFVQSVLAQLNVIHHTVYVPLLENAYIAQNHVERCYHCKKNLFETIRAFCQKNDIAHILDGTHTGDLHEHRPGLRALKELGILSPLADLHFSKEDIRSFAQKLDLPVAHKAASPCLATRFPYNTELTAQLLTVVDDGESFLHSLGLTVCRLRVHGNIARLEVGHEDFSRVLEQRTTIIHKLKQLGFSYITLDIEGFRSGSMDGI